VRHTVELEEARAQSAAAAANSTELQRCQEALVQARTELAQVSRWAPHSSSRPVPSFTLPSLNPSLQLSTRGTNATPHARSPTQITHGTTTDHTLSTLAFKISTQRSIAWLLHVSHLLLHLHTLIRLTSGRRRARAPRRRANRRAA